MMVFDLSKTRFPSPAGTVPANPVLDLQDIKRKQKHLKLFVLRWGISGSAVDKDWEETDGGNINAIKP